MPFPDSDLVQAARPRLLAAGFGPDSPAASDLCVQAIIRIQDQQWSPDGAHLAALAAPDSWTRGPAAVLAAIETSLSEAVLLVFPSPRAREFRVLMRAQNRAARSRPDVDGQVWSAPRILPTGPGVARVTAPVPDLVQAIRGAGLSVIASSETDDHVGALTLYRLLADLATEGSERPIGALAVPPAATPDEVERAVKAACDALAQRLIAHREALASA